MRSNTDAEICTELVLRQCKWEHISDKKMHKGHRSSWNPQHAETSCQPTSDAGLFSCWHFLILGMRPGILDVARGGANYECEASNRHRCSLQIIVCCAIGITVYAFGRPSGLAVFMERLFRCIRSPIQRISCRLPLRDSKVTLRRARWTWLGTGTGLAPPSWKGKLTDKRLVQIKNCVPSELVGEHTFTFKCRFLCTTLFSAVCLALCKYLHV